MVHSLEAATTGRAKCRGCERAIAKGAQRLGARLPSPYADGEMTLWFHPRCGAYKCPEILLAALEAWAADDAEHARLAAVAAHGLAYPRCQRLDRAERAPSGQARCRSCRAAIAKGVWRARVVFFDESGRFNPGGFVHLGCVRAYGELPPDADVQAVVDRLLHFSPALAPADAAELRAALDA